MIKLSGTLTLRIINGRNGAFRVGRLLTTIGEFAVKDAVLDQYEEGSYEGEFGVTKIYPTYYSAAGRLVVEVRAELSSIALIKIDPLGQQETILEQDPLEEERNSAPKAEPMRKPKTRSPAPKAATETTEASDDAGLFGLLWPLTEQVKLDPTVDRSVFRQQRDRLKALGYTFQPVGQLWLQAVALS